jgi:methenyltetrahydrofolate cyclohydrolase
VSSARRLWHADAIDGPAERSSFADLLERVASSDPVPGAGPAAAWTCALAAALVEMVSAVMSRRDGDGSGELAARSERAAAIRAGTLALAGRDMAVYREVLAVRSAADPELLRAALAAAADPPLLIAEAAAELTGLAADAFAGSHGAVRGEAVTAAVLAEAAARAAAAIVVFNLAGDPADPRRDRARELVAQANAQRARTEAG